MSASFKIVVSQPTASKATVNRAGSHALTSSDSVCSTTFINLNKPIHSGSTVHLRMRPDFHRRAYSKDLAMGE